MWKLHVNAHVCTQLRFKSWYIILLFYWKCVQDTMGTGLEKEEVCLEKLEDCKERIICFILLHKWQSGKMRKIISTLKKCKNKTKTEQRV